MFKVNNKYTRTESLTSFDVIDFTDFVMGDFEKISQTVLVFALLSSKK